MEVSPTAPLLPLESRSIDISRLPCFERSVEATCWFITDDDLRECFDAGVCSRSLLEESIDLFIRV